ncbi:uncharacterized protein LOC130807596 isoform X1 [Amaranthus tricolor]|uniref:uncharacterized protein LOC130807596 isoform X1 n=1 Tax=Amaranthus tricolor TaxID=29722 RepID=UPI00258D84A8|nr:uncharacterized protein LOC130807596 isoform X1 [Amaranthus tricolor]
MSDSSRPGFTVTLGRSGRVVKRAGGLSDEGFRNDGPRPGSKRSVRDRLGGYFDDRNHPNNKRQRGEGFGTSSVNDMHLHKGDLRFKLMQKSTSQKPQNSVSHGNLDLRDKLLSRNSMTSVNIKAVRSPESTLTTRHSLVPSRDAGIVRQPLLESRNISILGRYPSSRNPSDLSVMEPTRPCSSWTLDNLRRRSPERLYRSSAPRGISPERSREDLQRRSIRVYDDGRPASCIRSSPTRPVISSPFLTKSSLPSGPVKSAVPLSPHYPQASGLVRKIPSMSDEHLSVESWLRSLGLEKYIITFKAEEIDMNSLKQLGDSDLKELGIPMGPRKKMIQSLLPRPRRLP